MKNLITLISAILFSTLFYKQDIGLNLVLFSILTCTVLLIKNIEIIRHRDVLFKMIAYLITAVMVFFYNSTLAILANIISFITLIGSVSHPKTSIYINWLNGIYTSIASYFSNLYDKAFIAKENSPKKTINYLQWLKIIGIPSVFILIFISLYRNGNPVFDELIGRIDFSIINVQWVIFTFLGYFLFYNISKPIFVEPATSKDLLTGNYLSQIKLENKDFEKLKSEKHLGLVLLSVLSILIVIFLTTDVSYLTQIYGMTAAELSQQVHNGVNALILSNVIAIAIILYFFRGKLNFYNQNSDLKKITITWIFLNLLVVISTVLKNLEYINSFGLTYKRIGVLFFLTATSIGLITTFLKVFQVKNMWYLFRKNLCIAFVIFIISTTVNWDKLITYYNLNILNEAEISYLIGLSDNNTFLLYEYMKSRQLKPNQQERIIEKYQAYIKKLNDNSWQELVFDNFKSKR